MSVPLTISFLLVFTWTLLTLLSSGRILASISVVSSSKQQISNGKSSSESQDVLNNLKDDPFCNSIRNAITYGPSNRTYIQTFVTNSGHLPFLHNALLSMRKSDLFWNPLVLAIGTDVCPTIETFSGVGTVVCVPYLDRLLHQLQRDEPQSLEQIKAELLHKYNNTLSSSQSSSLFDHIEQNVFGWGNGVEYKFLINAKLYALRDVMECGPDAFITDTDIGFRQDPRPYFDIDGLEGDIIGQNDTNSEIYKVNMNSGFMYWKRTKRNLDLIDDIIKVPPFQMKNQMRVNNRVHYHKTPHTILDEYKFPNGWMLRNHFHNLTDIVMFHANWDSNQDRKVNMLKRAGLWFLSAGNETNNGQSYT